MTPYHLTPLNVHMQGRVVRYVKGGWEGLRVWGRFRLMVRARVGVRVRLRVRVRGMV